RADTHLETAEQQVLGVDVIQQRLQPVEQEILAVLPLQPDLDRASWPHRCKVFYDHREQRLGRLGEQRVQIGRTDAQTQISGVVEGLVHTRIVPQGWRRGLPTDQHTQLAVPRTAAVPSDFLVECGASTAE